MCLSLKKPPSSQGAHSTSDDSPRRTTFRRLPEIVVFLSTLGNRLAGTACYFFTYRYYARKWNFPFDYKNRRQTCGGVHFNKTQLGLESQVKYSSSSLAFCMQLKIVLKWSVFCHRSISLLATLQNWTKISSKFTKHIYPQ